MRDKTKLYCCPTCGSYDVEELLLVWADVNSGELLEDEAELAEAYDEHYWCVRCVGHIPHLVEEKKSVG